MKSGLECWTRGYLINELTIFDATMLATTVATAPKVVNCSVVNPYIQRPIIINAIYEPCAEESFIFKPIHKER